MPKPTTLTMRCIKCQEEILTPLWQCGSEEARGNRKTICMPCIGKALRLMSLDDLVRIRTDIENAGSRGEAIKAGRAKARAARAGGSSE